jgi:hypothetical protein
MRGRAVTTAVASGVLVAGFAISSAVGAAPAGSGASIVVQQNGVTTHTVCASEDVVLAASGFAPNRKVVQARVQIVGSGVLFNVAIPLTAGAGTYDTGSPGPDFIGDKFRVRYQTGSSSNTGNNGSFSATIVDC